MLPSTLRERQRTRTQRKTEKRKKRRKSKTKQNATGSALCGECSFQNGAFPFGNTSNCGFSFVWD